MDTVSICLCGYRQFCLCGYRQCLPVCLSVFLSYTVSICLCVCLSVWIQSVSTCLSVCVYTVSIFLSVCLSYTVSIYSTCVSVSLCGHSQYLSVFVWIVSVYLSVCVDTVSVQMSVCLSVCLYTVSIYVSVCQSGYISIYLSVCAGRLRKGPWPRPLLCLSEPTHPGARAGQKTPAEQNTGDPSDIPHHIDMNNTFIILSVPEVKTCWHGEPNQLRLETAPQQVERGSPRPPLAEGQGVPD